MKPSQQRPPKTSLTLGLGGLLASQAVRSWMGSLDCRGVFYDRSVDPAAGLGGPPCIYVFWHEYILLPLAMRGHCHLAMLLSQHRDADILARVAYHMGFDCVRGSTYRGGARAIWSMFERSRQQHIAITPDGPRGPRRRLAQGPVYLASRMQLPLVVMGLGFDRPWRVKSWDRFAIPKPFSRARAVIGPPMHLPADLDRAGLEDSRLRVERLLNCLTTEAEAWAAAGTRKAGELSIRPQIAAPPQPAPQLPSLGEKLKPARAA